MSSQTTQWDPWSLFKHRLVGYVGLVLLIIFGVGDVGFLGFYPPSGFLFPLIHGLRGNAFYLVWMYYWLFQLSGFFGFFMVAGYVIFYRPSIESSPTSSEGA